jgi:hypothetical protein
MPQKEYGARPCFNCAVNRSSKVALLARKSMITAVVAVAALALLLVAVGGERADANPCASACYAQHNQCRISSKGSPSCDAALTKCLSSCKK